MIWENVRICKCGRGCGGGGGCESRGRSGRRKWSETRYSSKIIVVVNVIIDTPRTRRTRTIFAFIPAAVVEKEEDTSTTRLRAGGIPLDITIRIENLWKYLQNCSPSHRHWPANSNAVNMRFHMHLKPSAPGLHQSVCRTGEHLTQAHCWGWSYSVALKTHGLIRLHE